MSISAKKNLVGQTFLVELPVDHSGPGTTLSLGPRPGLETGLGQVKGLAPEPFKKSTIGTGTVPEPSSKTGSGPSPKTFSACTFSF